LYQHQPPHLLNPILSGDIFFFGTTADPDQEGIYGRQLRRHQRLHLLGQLFRQLLLSVWMVRLFPRSLWNRLQFRVWELRKPEWDIEHQAFQYHAILQHHSALYHLPDPFTVSHCPPMP
jgi:hypothetical protein